MVCNDNSTSQMGKVHPLRSINSRQHQKLAELSTETNLMIRGAQMKIVSAINFLKKLFFFRAKSSSPEDSRGMQSFNKENKHIGPVCCEKLDNCPFFKEYTGNPIVKKKWIDIYCCNLNTSQRCKRKEVYQRTGERPPIYMTPSGMMLPSK